ncbi:helix-turn-helix domain-containing protein [Candidatus Omnitrophota bacterium]
MNPVIKPISVVLKEARQNKGVSLDEVHKATKIHPNILRSLEDGTTLGLSHIYVKSYIKIYAKYLKIGQQELDKYFHPVPISKEKKPRFDVPFTTKGLGIKVKSLSKLSSLASLSFNIKRLRKPITISIASLVVLILLMGLIRGARQEDAIVLEKVTIEDSVSVATQAAPAKEEKSKEVRQPTPTKIEGDLRLTISATLDTWMQIKEDGEVVFRRILKKGDSETWQAKENLELWIANAGTVDLELNGKALAPLGKRGKLLRSVIVTKDGIDIKR